MRPRARTHTYTDEVDTFNDDDWDKFAVCKVQEDDDTWTRYILFALKSVRDPSFSVCLYFGTDEYEGLPLNTYILDRNNHTFFIQIVTILPLGIRFIRILCAC